MPDDMTTELVQSFVLGFVHICKSKNKRIIGQRFKNYSNFFISGALTVATEHFGADTLLKVNTHKHPFAIIIIVNESRV
jgi:hypothetical protein